MTFHVDGEPVQGGTSLDVRVHPGALRIAVKWSRPWRAALRTA